MATVLIVDDRALNRDSLSTLLSHGPHRVIEASDGAEALEHARAERPDLIISEILMPHMDGFEFVQNLRRLPPIERTPVIFYTAFFRLQEAKSLAQDCGVSVVIPKPSTPEVILEAVHAALNLPESLPLSAVVRDPPSQTRCADPIVERLSAYLGNLQRVVEEPSAVAGRGRKPTSGRDPLKLPEEIRSGWARLQGMSLRLATLTGLGTDLARERDPQKLLEIVCAAAQDISVARYAGLGVLDDTGKALRHFLSRGMETKVATLVGFLAPREGLLGTLLETGRPIRRSGLDGDPAKVGLPAGHPPVHSFLAVPLQARPQIVGWLYVVNKLGADGFTEDDERVVATLGAQAGVAYESVRLYDELQHHSAELLRTQQVLREREERLRQITENIREVFWIAKADMSEILYISPAYDEIWGRSRESLYESPMSWAEAIHPDDRKRVVTALANAAQTGMDELHRIVRRDGSVRWIHSLGFPVLDPSGQPYRIAGIAEDVTTRKQAELRLEGQYAVARLLTESSSLETAAPALLETIARSLDCVMGDFWEVDRGQDVLRCIASWHDPSVAASEFVAMSRRSVLASGVGLAGRVQASGAPVWIANVTRDRNFPFAAAAERAGLRGGFGFPIASHDRIIGVLEFFSRDVCREDSTLKQMLASIGTQIGQFMERCRAEQELLWRAAELARSNTELGRFAQVAAHDLQEPLRSISSYVQLLAQRYKGWLDADANEFIDFAVGGTRRMARLLDDLLTYSTVEHSQEPFEPVDCQTLMTGALGHLGQEIDESGAEVIREPLPVVMGSRYQVQMLFEQLIDNAIKFRGEHPPRVHVHARQNGREWIFSIRDNGIGIDPQYAERIFVIFQRLHPPDRFPGTGAGLAICRKIVEHHGGRIWVESQLGQGANFCFTLRDARASETREPAAAAA